MKCPRCEGGVMEERTNRQTGQKFYGCSNYPSCKLTMTPEALRRLSDHPPESLEEEVDRDRVAGQDRDQDQSADFWDRDDFEGVTGVTAGDGAIPEDMSREDI